MRLVSRLRLPLGWEAIEIYPSYKPEIWDENLAALWAERDLLAAVARRNLRAEQFRNIDPNAQARKQKTQLLAAFANLLDGPEEPLHQFIKESPQLISPTYARVWSKLRLGARTTDFVLREPNGDYVLVELENPSFALFRKDGQQSAELTHAIDQVTDWKRYLEDNLSYAQRELGLEGISVSPRCLVVIGRSNSLSEENRRKIVAMENDRPRLKIVTYDDLQANAHAAFQNLLGPLWDPGPNAEVYFLPPSK
jgi:antiviral defense system Shedu protein SduA